MKIKSIKKKVEVKMNKAKVKITSKCKKETKFVAAVALLLAVAGCHMGEIPTAQRSQTANTDVKFIVQEGGNATFKFGAEFVSLAQANETSGAETMTASPSNTPTVDTKPDIDVSVPVNKAGAGQSVGSVIGDAVAGLISGATRKGESYSCDGSSCSTCTDGSCSDGACEDYTVK